MEGKKYIGIHLHWDYEKRELRISMKGYVEQALKEFEHETPKKPFRAPSKMEPPKYGEPIQYAKIDDSPSLAMDLIKFIQKAFFCFLFLFFDTFFIVFRFFIFLIKILYDLIFIVI